MKLKNSMIALVFSVFAATSLASSGLEGQQDLILHATVHGEAGARWSDSLNLVRPEAIVSG